MNQFKHIFFFTCFFAGVSSCKVPEAETSQSKFIPSFACVGKRQITKRISVGKIRSGDYQLLLTYGEARKASEQRDIFQDANLGVQAAINGGFFSESSYELATWHSVGPLSGIPGHKNGIFRGDTSRPRSCLSWSTAGDFYFDRNQADSNHRLTSSNYQTLCAGPMVIKDGNSQQEQALCDEQFSSRCRNDGAAILSESKSLPRSGLCLTDQSELMLFHVSHGFLHCGLTIKDMTDWMLQEGCRDGMMLDGGDTAQMILKQETEDLQTYHSPWMFHRKVPIWLFVSDRD